MGAWLSRHPDAAGKVIMFEGAEADIPTFDGGEAGAVTDISGPMWEKVSEMDARMPIGPGTLPSTTAIGIGDTGGEEKHELTEGEMPTHRHKVVANVDQNPGPAAGGLDIGSNSFIAKSSNFDGAGGPNSYHLGGATPEPTLALTTAVGGSGSPKATESHNTLPPYRAIWFIRKTARKNYRL
jgi:microcystin-dependent protein